MLTPDALPANTLPISGSGAGDGAPSPVPNPSTAPESPASASISKKRSDSMEPLMLYSSSNIPALISNIRDDNLRGCFYHSWGRHRANVDFFGGKALKCTECKAVNVRYSVGERLVAQGAPFRCPDCRVKCWVCGRRHVCGQERPGNVDMCKSCRLGIIIDRAKSATELNTDLADVMESELHVHGSRAYLFRRDNMLWPEGGQAVDLVEQLLKKCKNGLSRIDCDVGVHPKLAEMLRERGVSEDAISSMRDTCSDRCREADARFDSTQNHSLRRQFTPQGFLKKDGPEGEQLLSLR